MLLVLAVAGYFLDQLVDDQLTAYFDTTLDAKARSIVALTEQDEDGVELEIYTEALPRFSRKNDPDYFHMVDSSGKTLFASISAEGIAETLPNSSHVDNLLVLGDSDSENRVETKLQYFDLDLPDGRSGRWLAVSYYPRIDPDDDESEIDNVRTHELEQTLSTEIELSTDGLIMVNGVLIAPERVLTLVGTSRTELDQLIWAIDIILLLSGIVVAAAIVLIAGVGIRRAIAPLEQLGTDIAALDERSLDSRITLSKPIAELDVLVDQFNLLLERLTEAFGRERQFTTDVAHELRTPIAEMRNLIEVQARFPENTEIAATYSDDLLDSTIRMQHIVEQLMLLSKADHGIIDIGESVDLVALLNDLIESYQTKAEVNGMNVDFSTDLTTLTVSGSRVWPMILTNVLNNAIDHASSAGSIQCELSASRESFTLAVSNPSSDLVENDLAFMTHRLWQKDSARSDSSHSGLGLALVATYARCLELEVIPSLDYLHDTNTESCRFIIEFRGNHLTHSAPLEPVARDRDIQ